jgi:uncharacterized protein with NAD-binding domain and iron-sulfur cluster
MSTVIILGEEVAGMRAAQELINRGFEVEVYDRNPTYVGGKSLDVNVPNTNVQDPNKFLPSEHGFRFFPGFYNPDWNTPGNINEKKASECTEDEVKTEVWEQLKQEINVTKDILTDDMVRFVYLDADSYPKAKKQSGLEKVLKKKDAEKVRKLGNKEPLLVNQVDTCSLRPNAFTNIPNLLLAADYIKTNTHLDTMEGANEAEKRAINNILEIEKRKDYCKIYPLNQPLVLSVYQKVDQKHWKKGLNFKID